MNFYLLKLIGKCFNLLFVFILSIFNFDSSKNEYLVKNNNENKKLNIVTEVIEYKVINTYDSSIPKNISKVTKEGKEGIYFINYSGDKIVLEEAVNEEITVGTGKYGVYKGVITGYGPDCRTCDGKGIVSCRTREKKDFNLLKDGIYYDDAEYGKVRVLAAALTEFPCGTIIDVESKTLGNFKGIVLDTGYDMRKHLEMGIYHFDVAYLTEQDEMVAKTTDMSGTVIYNVQRWGW